MLKEQLEKELPEFRVKVKTENETLGRKIRDGETQKIPYLFVVGEKEETAGTVSMRKRSSGNMGSKSMREIVTLLGKEIKEKV